MKSVSPGWRSVVVALLLVVASACSEMTDATRILRIANHAEPASLDPHRSEGVPARNIQRDLFEGLVSEDAAGNLVPGVAARWQTSEDGLTWTFYLRDDARWSNGDAVTAGDFVFSLRRAVTPATGGIVSETLLPLKNAAAILRGTAEPPTLGVVAHGPRELVIELEAPTPWLAGVLAHPSTFPVHRASIEAHGDQWARTGTLIGNGAYRLVEWRVHSHIALERNPHYREGEQARIERVEYLPIEDERGELARFEAGDIHITYGVPPGRIEWLREHHGEALQLHPWLGVYYLGLNTTRAPLDDARVRRALSLAIDRELLVSSVTAGGETPAWNWIPAMGDYESAAPDWAGWSQQKRVALARTLLAEAGVTEPLSVELLYNTRDRDKRVVTAIAAMWKQQLGVETRLVNQEWKAYLQSRKQLDRTQVFRSGWIGEYADPNTFAEILHSSHVMNEFGWSNARYDALLEEAAQETDVARRQALFAAAENEIRREQPLIPLFHYAKARLVSPALEGYVGNLLDHHYSKHYRWREAQ